MPPHSPDPTGHPPIPAGGRLLVGLDAATQLALAIAGAEKTARLNSQYATRTLQEAVRDARLWLAEALLVAPPQTILSADRAALFAAVRLIRAAIRDLPRRHDEDAMAQTARDLCRRGWAGNDHAVAGYFLAEMFLQPFQSFAPPVDYEAVPADIRRGVVRHMVERPLFFDGEDEPEAYYDHITAVLEDINDRAESAPDDGLWAEVTAYAANTLDLLQAFPARRAMKALAVQRARLAERHLRSQGCQLDLPQPAPTPTGTRPRIGLLARAIGPRVESFINAAAIQHLDHTRHEVILYVLDDVEPGRIYHQEFRQHFEQVRDLQGLSVSDAVNHIRADQLDVLIATNVNAATLERMNSVYAHRLAPMQVLLSAISPTTTGHASFDVVITAKNTEPDDAQDQYSERIEWLDGHFNCFAFGSAGLPRRDDLPPTALTRAAFGLPQQATILLSGASYYKLCPHLSRTWISILAQAPDARLVLYPFNPHWSDRFAENALRLRLRREARELGVAPERIHLLAPLTREQCFAAAAAADLYLDSFPYSGAGSLVEPLATATPIIAMAGDTQRGCQGAAMVRAAGLDECVATDAADYITRAASLANDPVRRQRLRQHLAAHALASPVFDSEDYARRFWNCVDHLARKVRT